MNYYLTYYLTKVCHWFAHFHYVIANSTGMNPIVVRQLREEWNQWRNQLQLLELTRTK